jgi:hypothetical protein
MPSNKHLKHSLDIAYEDIMASEQLVKMVRQGGKSEQLAQYINFILSENVEHVRPFYDNVNTKGWESVVPDPDPFVRPVSNPSKKKRNQLRAKRKKK